MSRTQSPANSNSRTFLNSNSLKPQNTSNKEAHNKLEGKFQNVSLKQSQNSQQNPEKLLNSNQQIFEERPAKHQIHRSGFNPLPNSKPNKKVKISQQFSSEGQIIRFAPIKSQVTEQQLDHHESKKNSNKKRQMAEPWVSKSTRQVQDTCLRFHNETVQFYEYIKPTKREHETRLSVFNMIKQMILEKYPQASVSYFGSFATKLYLPDGDIDITILMDDIQQSQEKTVYDNLYKIIRNNQGTLFCDIQYIRNSKVPLIKFLHVDTQIPFDISVNKRDGIDQIQHVQRMKKLYPQFQPLVFVFKTALKIRNMSETYTGGIGSFLLFCMILHFLRFVHKKQYYYNMAEYIMKFMEFYAISGDWERKSIYVADGTQIGRARQPGTLSFYSPQDDSHDIGKSAFKIKDAFNVFKNRFRVIAAKNFKDGDSILKELINPAGEQFRYYKHEKSTQKL